MARPKDADSAKTWNRIVDAARRELFETPGGQPDVSVRKVATLAGVGIGTIHYYFPTKESLLEACLDQYYAMLDVLVRELATAAAGAAADPHAFIEMAARRLYRFVVSERRSLKLRAITNAQRGGLPPERRGLYPGNLAAVLATMLGIDAAETELTIETMNFVMMQYAVLDEDEVVRITRQSGDVARRAIEDHVVRVALRLVFPAPRFGSGPLAAPARERTRK
jgi:AcrR family transcriptional regulator